MTTYQLYYLAALTRYLRGLANSRVAALDVITSRRVRADVGTSLHWRKCGSRAGRVAMDRGYDAWCYRQEARERLTAERPWRRDVVEELPWQS